MPIMRRKPSASMTMVGLAAMKRPSGSAANSITAMATITAMYMMARCSVMPTAVMIESTENTRSSSRIWKMAPPTVRVTWPTMFSLPSSGSTVWWISFVAFQTRNKPPARRIRSRHEKDWSNALNSGCVSLAI